MQIVLGLTLVLLVMVGALCSIAWGRRIRREMSRAFDPAGWQRRADRWKMLTNLLKTRRLIGLSRSDACRLLGMPDGDDPRIAPILAQRNRLSCKHLAYRLSDASDCDLLVLHLNDSDVVVDQSHILGW
jgi:hypothetical protein